MATHKTTKAAGDLDPSFGDEGKVLYFYEPSNPLTPFGGSSELLSDGKIFTAGYHLDDIVLVRRLGNGALDDSFGSQGVTLINLMPGLLVRKSLSALQPDSCVLIFGSAGEKFAETLFIIRTLPNGKLDTSFGTQGRVFFDLAPGADIANALAIQSDAKIILSAASQKDPSGYRELLLRLDSDGRLDPTFGQDGIVSVEEGEFSSLIALPDDRLLLAGSRDSVGLEHGAVVFARYLSDGRADTDFGENGFVTIEIKSTLSAYILGMRWQEDGKIVAVGYVDIAAKGQHTLTMRINPDGSLDNAFNNGAVAIIGVGPGWSRSAAVAIQPDNKILAAGAAAGDLMLMRFLPNGALDMEFGSQGRVMTDMAGVDLAQNVTVQPDEKILVSGGIRTLTGHGIARYLS